jgi:hypothetical protein
MYLFFTLLERVVPNFVLLQKRHTVFSIGLIYVTLNFLYFTNIIPPIPLSLKEVGIFQNVIRHDNGLYDLTYEKPEWWDVFRKSDRTVHYSAGEPIFCYTSVFAPSRLGTKIYHRWDYYDEKAGAWKNYGRFEYPIQGGRGDGYRGYTQVSNVHEGVWRCTVETERGQVLGREKFDVVIGPRPPLMTRTE